MITNIERVATNGTHQYAFDSSPFRMPRNDDELAARISELAIEVSGKIGSKTWRKRAQASLAQVVQTNGHTISRQPKVVAKISSNDHLATNGAIIASVGSGWPTVTEYEIAVLGPRAIRTDIESSVGPFQYFPQHRSWYPNTVTQALGDLYQEYNQAFRPLVEANREWATDYQYCMRNSVGSPVNYFVQIDMIGLSDGYLQAAAGQDPNQVREDLRGKIFEVENSLAMYGLLTSLFAYDGQESFFGKRFRESLDTLRRKHHMPIALLAVTDQKYQSMRTSEFGKHADQPVPDGDVRRISGFDRFFGPADFQRYLTKNGGKCDFLLYARTSDPLAKLKNPDTKIKIPLLEDDEMRKIIKAHAITFNIDNPTWELGSPRRINDTKAYLQPIGIGYATYAVDDLISVEFAAYLSSQEKSKAFFNGEPLSAELADFLRSREVDSAKIISGEAGLRAKPMQGAYGSYGHFHGSLVDRAFRHNLQKHGYPIRGPYVIQPEMQIPTVINQADGQAFTQIDRNFLEFTNGEPRFLGGFRSFMPVDSQDAKMGRNHGSSETVWAEIYD